VSDEPANDGSGITYTPHEGPYDPNDGVATYGWRFERLRRRKVRCAICQRWTRYGVVAHDADVDAEGLKMICKRCYDEMP
jgi:hypothetical protein